MVDRRLHGFHPLRVMRVIDETPEARSFVLEVPDELRDLFHYRAGQFCTFRLPIGDDEVLRSYSMSSSPDTGDELTVTVKRVPGGLASNWLHDRIGEGDTLWATKPAGVFCPGDEPRPIVAFCGGSGVTPVMSIVKSELARSDRTIRMLYANRTRGSVIFDDHLGRLESSRPDRLRVHHHLDDVDGLLDAAAIAAFVGEDRDADFFVCGPRPFMDLVRATLDQLGVDADRIAVEHFVNAGQAVPAADPRPSESTDDGSGAASDRTEGEDGVPQVVTIVLKGARHEIAYQAGDTVLETARRGGLTAPFSCEAGNCATCMAQVHEGTVRMRTNNALTPEEVDEGLILTCQSLPTSDVLTVEYESF